MNGNLNTNLQITRRPLTFEGEEIFYPETDGKPMAETDRHRDLMVN